MKGSSVLFRTYNPVAVDLLDDVAIFLYTGFKKAATVVHGIPGDVLVQAFLLALFASILILIGGITLKVARL